MWRGRVATAVVPDFVAAPIRCRLKGQPPGRRQPSHPPVVAFEKPTMRFPLRVARRRSNPTKRRLTTALKSIDPKGASKVPPDRSPPSLHDPPEHDEVSTCCTAPERTGSPGLPAGPTPAIVDMIQGEHPQIIATILVHLEPDQASTRCCWFDRPRLSHQRNSLWV